ALAEIGSSAIAPLVRLLKNPNNPNQVRWDALESLRRMGNAKGIEAVVPCLVDLLTEEHSDLRASAIITLGQMCELAKPALSALEKCMSDLRYPQNDVAEALYRINPENKLTLPHFVKELQSKDPVTRRQAAASVAEIRLHDNVLVDLLIRELGTPERLNQLRAVYALGTMGPFASKAIPHIK